MDALKSQARATEGLQVQLRRRLHAGLLLDLSIDLGSEIGILFGVSGAGKTSLLRLIAGLILPDEGVIRLDSRTLFNSAERIDLPLRRRKIGMIFQHDLLFPHLTVERNVGFGLQGWSRDRARVRLHEIAELCGVDHLLNRQPETLSGGERQRVGLARTLAPQPRLLLCDEPVSAIDHANRRTLIDRLKQIQCVERIPILYVTHDPAEAIGIGQTLFLLEQGRLTARGAPLDILSRHDSFGHKNWSGLRNSFPATLSHHASGEGATYLNVQDGPLLRVSAIDALPGTEVFVEIKASDIILANGPITGLSAQNIVPGIVERIVYHGSEAEVLVRTNGVVWIVSVVRDVIGQLGLSPSHEVCLIAKARSCRVSRARASASLDTLSVFQNGEDRVPCC